MQLAFFTLCETLAAKAGHLEPGVLGEAETGANRSHGVPAIGVSRHILIGALQADLQARAAICQHLSPRQAQSAVCDAANACISRGR